MTNDQRFPSPSRWGRLGLGLVALTFAFVNFSVAAEEEEEEATFTAIRAADTDSMRVSASGRANLTLSRAPASATEAKLHVVNSETYSIWTGDLTRQGSGWVAQLDLAALEALLVANAVQAEFPKAASDGKDLRISILRDNFDGMLDSAAALVGTEPLFYQAPEAPEALEAIEDGADATRVSSYAMAARRYDEQLAAYELRLKAAKSTAKALWTDLKTSGRLPNWPDAILKAQERAFESIDTQALAVKEQREKARSTAKAIVDRWNASNSDAEPVELQFREAS
jgi:hypothetical protein